MSVKEGIRKHWVVWLSASVFFISSTYQALAHSLGTVPDEAYHLTAIRSYAQQWSPIISRQADLTATGDLTRNPSYLYHYLMSFPYRITTALGFNSNQAWRITCLLSVILGLLSVWLLYRLLQRVTTNAVSQSIIAVYALLPITTIVFAGPNYDNLLLPLVFLTLILVLDLIDRFSLHKALLTLSLLISGCIVKLAFLPFAIVLIPIVVYGFYLNRAALYKHELPQQLPVAMAFIACTLLLVTSVGLGWERLGRNIVRYGNPQPSCQVIQPKERCLLYSVNQRNDAFAAANKSKPRESITVYVFKDWCRYMIRGLAYPSSRLKLVSAMLIAYSGLAGAALVMKRRHGYTVLQQGLLLLAVAGLYLGVLFLDNYLTYQKLGEPFAINGRYLLPALPFVLVPVQASLMAVIRRRYHQLVGGLGLVCLVIGQLTILFRF